MSPACQPGHDLDPGLSRAGGATECSPAGGWDTESASTEATRTDPLGGACGAASGAPRAGLGLGRPARRKPGHTRRGTHIKTAHTSCWPVQGRGRLPRSRLSSSRPARQWRHCGPSLCDRLCRPWTRCPLTRILAPAGRRPWTGSPGHKAGDSTDSGLAGLADASLSACETDSRPSPLWDRYLRFTLSLPRRQAWLPQLDQSPDVIQVARPCVVARGGNVGYARFRGSGQSSIAGDSELFFCRGLAT
jgi:hypothetical protein